MPENFRGRLATLGIIIFLLGLIAGLCGLLIAGVEVESVFLGLDMFGTDRPYSRINGLAWSPDGSQLAFECVERGFPYEARASYVMEADGSHIRPFADNWPLKNFSREAWSPDGSRLAFVAGGGHYDTLCGSNIYVSSLIRGAQRVYPPLGISLQCPHFLNERGTIAASIASAGAQNLPVAVSIQPFPLDNPPHFNTPLNREITLAAHETVDLTWTISLSGEARAYALKALAVSAGVQQVATCIMRVGAPPPHLAILDNLGLTAGQVLLLSLVSLLLGVALPVPWLSALEAETTEVVNKSGG
jgi:hypothetical protein